MSRPLFYAVFIMALMAVALPSAALARGPRIAFDKTEIIFPFVKEGETRTAKFTFRNTGDQNLIIDRVAPSCGCTVATFDKVVKPGESGVITLELDTTGITGAFRKTAVVASNDPSKPNATLVILGETLSRLKVDKGRRIDLIGCLGSDISTVATLSDPDGRPVLITRLENPMKDYLKATLEPLPGGKQYRLHLKAVATKPIEFAGPLFLHVAGSGKVTIFIYCEVNGKFKVMPHEVHFGTVSPGMQGGMQRPIVVEAACADELKIDSIVYDDKKFKVEQRWEVPARRLALIVTPRAEVLGKGPFEAKLSVHANGESIAVLLKGVVR